MSNFNYNKSILGGRLTANPELKTTPNGTSVCSFTIAVNRRSREQQTDFINCVAFKDRAEVIAKYFNKGSSICVTGSIQTRTWTDQQNNKRYATEVMVDEVHFVDSKSESTAPAPAPASAPPSEFDTISDDSDLPF